MLSLPSTFHFVRLLLFLVVLVNVSCVGPLQKLAALNTVPKGWWHGEGVAGKPKIVIDLTAQEVRYYKSGTLVGESPISSGREGHSTMTGTYHIIEKDVDHRSSIYGAYCDDNRQIVVPDVDCTKDECPKGTHFIGASMPFFMRISGGVGMHEGYLPGYPASHGCIRLPREMAEAFYFATPVGTPVEIQGDASLAESRKTTLTPPEASTPKPKKSASNGTVAVKTQTPPKSDATKSWWQRMTEPKRRPGLISFGTTQYLE